MSVLWETLSHCSFPSCNLLDSQRVYSWHGFLTPLLLQCSHKFEGILCLVIRILHFNTGNGYHDKSWSDYSDDQMSISSETTSPVSQLRDAFTPPSHHSTPIIAPPLSHDVQSPVSDFLSSDLNIHEQNSTWLSLDDLSHGRPWVQPQMDVGNWHTIQFVLITFCQNYLQCFHDFLAVQRIYLHVCL